MSAMPDRGDNETPPMSFYCSRCGIHAVGDASANGDIPTWAALIVRRRDGASVGVAALDAVIDLCPVCVADLGEWWQSTLSQAVAARGSQMRCIGCGRYSREGWCDNCETKAELELEASRVSAAN
jgi:hypothetical protein